MTRRAMTTGPHPKDGNSPANQPGGDSPAPDKPQRPAWRSTAAIILFVAVTLGGLAADLWSKHAVFSALLADPDIAPRAQALAKQVGPDQTRDVLKALDLRHNVGGGLRLTLSTNPGVVFGLPMPPLLVAVATVLTILMVSWFFAVSAARSRWTHIALGLILAGALGNFYDRMIAKVFIPGVESPVTGQVRDFLDLSQIEVLGRNYPYIFNVADVWLVVGVIMLMLYWIFGPKPNQSTSRPSRIRKTRRA